jgi:hypothetical protein
MLHAGTYDPHDFLTQRGMGAWGRDLENSWFAGLDAIYVATEFHRQLVLDERKVCGSKVVVTGFPAAWPDSFAAIGPLMPKEKLVVFPHRLAPEKDPALFQQVVRGLAPAFPDWRFVCTKDVCKDKGDYYRTLARASVSVSCAKQETWGIAMLESTVAGCMPVVPEHLSYPEIYPVEFRYEPGDVQGLRDGIVWAMQFAEDLKANSTSRGIRDLQDKIHKSCRQSIPNMVAHMRAQGWNV